MNEESVRWSCRAARSAARLTLGSTRKPINAVRFVPGVFDCVDAIGLSLDAKAAGGRKLEVSKWLYFTDVILYQTMLNKIKWRQRVENDNGD